MKKTLIAYYLGEKVKAIDELIPVAGGGARALEARRDAFKEVIVMLEEE